jgi:FKBP-type peptidyl-prolyl cis-trans isomerase FkpA
MIITNITRRIVAVSALTLASACLSGESIAPEQSIEEATFASALGVNLAASTRTTNGAYYRDIVVGTGALVASGQDISIRYTGWLSNGAQFETNLSNSSPLKFKLGAGEVIDGFDEGLAGIRVGGKRQLIIPPSLGYGPYNYGPIPGNSILVFTVEVVPNQ